jgi:hypothetical protein
MLQGGIAGWAGGKATPGGGWNAAQNHFDRQRQLQMQYALMNRQLQNDQYRNMLEYARTQHTINQPYFTGRGSQPIPGTNANGQRVLLARNPWTGDLEQVPDFGPDNNPKQTADQTTWDSDRGVIVDRTKGTFSVPSAATANENSGDNGAETVKTGLPTGPLSQTQAGNIPKTAPGTAPSLQNTGNIPTTAPGSVSPAASPSAIRVGSGNSLPTLPPKQHGSAVDKLTQQTIDELRQQHPNWSNAQVLKAVQEDRSTKDNTGTITPQQERSLRSQFATREEASLRQLQSEQERDLDELTKNAAGDSAFVDQKDVAAIQKKYDGLRQDLHGRMVEEAAGIGIDLTQPMVGKKGALPRTAPGTGNIPPNGTVRMYKGVPFVFNGSKYVRQQATQ